MNIERPTGFESALIKRAAASGDPFLRKAVIHLVNNSVALRYQNSMLHLGINPYTDPASTNMNRVARHTRKLAAILAKCIKMLPAGFEGDQLAKGAASVIAKAEWTFTGMNIPPLMKDEKSEIAEPCEIA